MIRGVRYGWSVWWILLVSGFIGVAFLSGQVNYLVPLWTGKAWSYVSLGPTLSVTAGKLGVVSAPVPLSNDLYVLTAAQASLTLKCIPGDVYRNGILQAEAGNDYSVDTTGKIVTFAAASTPQSGDIVKVIYRCSQ